MTPEELAGLASIVSSFSADQIDRLYHLARWIDADSEPITPALLGETWRSMAAAGDEESHVGDDVCLGFIGEVLAVDVDVPVAAKYLRILGAAKINLILPPSSASSSPSSSPPLASPPLRASTPTDDTIKSVDENSPRWRQAVAIDRRKLIAQVLDVWTERVQERREAYENFEDPAQNASIDQRRREKLARRVLFRWREQVAKIKEMERKADEFRFRKDAEYALRNWTLASREKLFIRVRDARAAKKALDIWREKTARIREMEDQADQFCNLNAARNVLGRMTQTTRQHQEDEARAVALHEENLAKKTSNKWLEQTQQRQQDEERADAAADFFAAKHVIQKMKTKALDIIAKKQETQAREHMLAWKYIRKWRVATKQSKEAKYAEAYKIMRRKIQENTARSALQKWRDKLREIREMEQAADEFRARKDEENAKRVAHDAIVTMYNKTEQMQEAEQVADDFAKRKLVERLQIFGSTWLEPTRQIMENNKVADEYRATRLASYALEKLRDWKNAAFRARRLEADADALRELNERKRVWNILTRWRDGAVRPEEAAAENTLVPATPAARRSQLLASTTPAYTPGSGLLGAGGRVEEDEDEEE